MPAFSGLRSPFQSRDPSCYDAGMNVSLAGRALACSVLIACLGCTHYPDLRGEDPKAKAWVESERKREEQERNRAETRQTQLSRSGPDDVPAPPPPPPRTKRAPSPP
jgi:hypothetical protein